MKQCLTQVSNIHRNRGGSGGGGAVRGYVILFHFFPQNFKSKVYFENFIL